VFGVGCWVLGVGCWVLGVGCCVLGVGCWVLRVGVGAGFRSGFWVRVSGWCVNFWCRLWALVVALFVGVVGIECCGEGIECWCQCFVRVVGVSRA